MPFPFSLNNSICRPFALLWIGLFGISGYAQPAWIYTYPSLLVNPLTFESSQPIETDSAFVLLQQATIYQAGAPKAYFAIRSLSKNGLLQVELKSDSISWLNADNLVGGTILSTPLNGHIVLLTKERISNTSGKVKRIILEDDLSILSVDSIVCNNCPEWPNAMFTDAEEVLNGRYLIGGAYLYNPRATIELLDFNIQSVDFKLYDIWQFGSTVMNISLLYQSPSHMAIMYSDGPLYHAQFLKNNLTIDTIKTTSFFSNSNLNHLAAQGTPLSGGDYISAVIFRGFSFSDTGRVGLLWQDQNGYFLDSVSWRSSTGSWFEGVQLCMEGSNPRFVIGSHKTTSTSRFYEYGTIDVHRITNQRTKDWSITLGQKKAYCVLQSKATSDGGVVLVNRYFDNGEYLHEIVKIDSLGNTVSVVELDDPIKAFTLYPNPANEKVFIHWSTEPKGELKYTLQSTSGQTLQSGCYQPSEGIDCSHLAAGVYQLMLWANGQPIGTERLVVD